MQISRRSSLLSVETKPIAHTHAEAIVDTSSAVDSILKDLQPVIHYIALFIRLTQWKDSKKTKYSLALFLSLIIWWTIHRYVLCLLPLVLVMMKIQHDLFFSFTRHQQENQLELISDLTEIRNTVCLVSSIKNWIQKSDTLCRAYYQYYSVATTKERSVICFGVACLFTMVYAGWTFLVYQQMITGCDSLVWFFILVIMCLHSPWVNPICVACVRAVAPLVHYLKTNVDNEAPMIGQPVVSTNDYCFQIYHHQRWWFPTGWSNILLPQDPPVWSDEHLESTPPVHDFKLPPDTHLRPPNDMNQQRIVSWTWIDPYWSKQKDDGGDKQAWQYGNKWKAWSSESSGSGFFTRRRKWVRYAQRKEYWVKVDSAVKESSCCSSMIGGSNTTYSSSIYNWDDTSLISPSPSISTISDSPLKPILLANEVRRSSHSVTFKIPVLSCNQQTVNHDHLKKN